MTLSEAQPFAALSGARVNDSPAGSTLPVTGAFDFADTPALTQALRRGDEAAFRWLHMQWNVRLFRYCFAIAGGDEALATEVAQNAYLRLARHVRPMPDAEALWNWLARAARDAASDLRRTGGRYRGALARFAAWFCPASTPADDRLGAALDAALLHLDAEERQLVEARYFQRRPLEEIGTQLACTARAIEGRLSRLREKLRGLIAEELKSP